MQFQRFAGPLFTIVLLSLASSAMAVSHVWIKAGGTGDWSNPSNWSPAGPPSAGDDVFCTSSNPNGNFIFIDSIAPPALNLLHSVTIDESGAGSMTLQQPGFTLNTLNLTVGLGGVGTYTMSGGFALVGSGTMNNLSNLIVGSGASFLGTNFTQNNGTVTVNGGWNCTNYTQNKGTVIFNGNSFGGSNFTQSASARVFSNGTTMTFSGTYTYNGGSFAGIGATGPSIVNCGTFIDNAGTFGGGVDTSHLILSGNGTFGGNVINRGSIDEPAGRTIFASTVYDQAGGTMQQSGFLGGDAPNIVGGRKPEIGIGGGATWFHFAAMLQGNSLNVGAGYGGGGTYSIGAMVTFGANTAGVNVNNINVGALSDGTIIHPVGLIQAGAVTVGGSGGLIRGTLPPPGQRGYYFMSGVGTLLANGLIVGQKEALFGQFTQSGGDAEIGQLIVNVNSTSTGIVNLSGGTFHVQSESSNNGTIAVSGGVMSINDNLNGAGTVSVTGGSFTVARLRQDAVMLDGSGQMAISLGFGTIGGSATSTSRVHSLSFEETGGVVNGRWDLSKNRLVVDYSGASPADTIRRYLSSGAALSTGLFSRAAATDPTHSTALGYAESSAIFGASGGVFVDLFVDSTAILIKYTMIGDANFDTTVDTIDFNALAANFAGSGKQWPQGDFDYSGTVNSIDFNLLVSNFSKTLPAETSSPVVALVPEPVSIGFALSLAYCLAQRCRRNASRLSRVCPPRHGAAFGAALEKGSEPR